MRIAGGWDGEGITEGTVVTDGQSGDTGVVEQIVDGTLGPRALVKFPGGGGEWIDLADLSAVTGQQPRRRE